MVSHVRRRHLPIKCVNISWIREASAYIKGVLFHGWARQCRKATPGLHAEGELAFCTPSQQKPLIFHTYKPVHILPNKSTFIEFLVYLITLYQLYWVTASNDKTLRIKHCNTSSKKREQNALWLSAISAAAQQTYEQEIWENEPLGVGVGVVRSRTILACCLGYEMRFAFKIELVTDSWQGNSSLDNASDGAHLIDIIIPESSSK
jgi:hypothetical protein